jgi:pimeloyl-ACP methyl ester carboxylesterase
MTDTPIYKTAEGQGVVMALYDRVLARWPVAFEALNIDTRHGRTSAIASGEASAPPLVLLHGSCSNAVSWIGDVEAYSRHFRVYAVDLPGEPGRSSPNRPPWAGPAFAEWLEDLLDGLACPKASLLGISQGGWTALRFATHRPERVGRLVLLAPGGVTPARMSFLLRAIPLSMLGRRGAEALNRITFGDQPIAEEAVVFMNAIMTHLKPRIGAQVIFTDAELRRLTMPVLLIAGARDALFASEKTAARLEKLLPQFTVHMLPEAGHVLHGLAAEIMPFLAATG